jgi:hypothetical protein
LWTELAGPAVYRMQKNKGLDVLSEDEAIYYSKKLVLLSPHHSPLCHASEDHNVNISRTGFGMGSE